MFEDKNVTKSVIAVFVLLAVFLLSRTVAVLWGLGAGENTPAQSVITVSGKGEVLAVPDIATFSLSVIENGKTVGDAQKKATDKIANVLAALKVSNVSDADVQTTSYNIYPQYEYVQPLCPLGGCPSKQVLRGYEVNESLSVKVRKIDTAGAVLSAVGLLGVSNVSGLQFSVDKQDEYVVMARKKAIEDAKIEAKKLATDLGVKLVRIINYSEQNGGQQPPMYYGKTMAVSSGSAAPVPISTGENKISSNVVITYEIR